MVLPLLLNSGPMLLTVPTPMMEPVDLVDDSPDQTDNNSKDNTMHCSQCGHENKPNAKFCTSCGQALTSTPQPTADNAQQAAEQARKKAAESAKNVAIKSQQKLLTAFYFVPKMVWIALLALAGVFVMGKFVVMPYMAGYQWIDWQAQQHHKYVKISETGEHLADSAKSWACVLNTETNLMWEVKKSGAGLHDKNKTYRWGGAGISNIAITDADADKPRLELWDHGGDTYDDWDTLVEGSNDEALCGLTGWRVPTLYELATLVQCRGGVFKSIDDGCGGDYKRPTIDTRYFPNTSSSSYWSASPYAYLSANAWSVFFSYGNDNNNLYRTSSKYVRLVRTGQ